MYVCTPEVEAGVESSSTQGNQDTPELVPETGPGPSSEQGGWEPASPFSPFRATIGLVGGITAGSLRVQSIWLLLAQDHHGAVWMTQTWIQPLGIVSHAQTQMRCLCKLPPRNTGRGYGPPVG